MQFDDQLQYYFGATDLDTITPSVLEAGSERMRVDLGMATDASHRFALWSLLFMLKGAPDLDVVFKTASEREAARNFMDLVSRTEE